MKQYQTYIFDLDGTITDTTGIWIQIFRDCLEHIGVDASKLTDLEIAQHTHNREGILELGANPDDIVGFFERAVGIATEQLPNGALFPQAYETLQAIRAAGKNVAIFSTTDRLIFEPVMLRNGLHDVVQVAIAGTDVPRYKPHPDGILKALKDLGVAEEDFGTVMYMGDKDTDIQAAHNAGVDAILFFPPIHQAIYDRAAAEQHKPTATIASWGELLESLDAAPESSLAAELV